MACHTCSQELQNRENAINYRIGPGSERDSYKTNPYTWVGGIHLSRHRDPLVWISTTAFLWVFLFCGLGLELVQLED
jgi:hypothetical protein